MQKVIVYTHSKKKFSEGGFDNMNRKVFYAFIMIAALMFAAVSLGGCGGGGSKNFTHNNNSSEQSDAESEHGSTGMLSVRETDEFKALMAELEADGTMAKFNANKFYYFETDMLSSQDEVAKLKEAYDKGHVITMFDADINDVNSLLETLDEIPEDESITGSSGMLEMFFITKRRDGEVLNTYEYVAPYDSASRALHDEDTEADLTEVSSDSTGDYSGYNLESDGTDEKVNSDTDSYTRTDFLVDLWRDYFNWVANLPAADTESSVSDSSSGSYDEVRASVDDLTNIADSQTKTINFSYSGTQVDGIKFDGKTYNCMKFTKDRTNTVSYVIYSAHSFSNGKDYYLIQANTSTVPKNFKDTYVYPFGEDRYKFNYLYGYTWKIVAEQWIDDGSMSVDDVALIRNAPANVNKSTSHTEGMSWNISGKVGVNKDGVSAELGGGVQYSKSKTWTTTEYSIVNDSMKKYPASAAWYAEVSLPSNGDSHFVGLAPYRRYRGINAVSASTRQLQFDSEWIWEVGKDYWKNHKNLTMNIKFTAYDGASVGESEYAFWKYSRYDTWFSRWETASFKLNPPAHMTINQSRFNFGSGDGHATFYVLSESDWTAESDADWCIVADSTKSGTATGTNEQPVMLDVIANTTGASRIAHITLKNTDGDVVTFTATQAR